MFEKLILFDIDGTLCKNNVAHQKAFNIAIKETYSIIASVHEIEHDGYPDKRIILELLMKKGLSKEFILERIDECMSAMAQVYPSLIAQEPIRPIENTNLVLDFLKNEGFLLGVVTGNVEGIAKEKLRSLGLQDYFQIGGFGNEDIVRSNLVLNAIQKAKDFHGFILDDNVYVVGDTPQDVKAALESNTTPICVTTGNYDKIQLEQAGAKYILITLDKDTLNKILRE